MLPFLDRFSFYLTPHFLYLNSVLVDTSTQKVDDLKHTFLEKKIRIFKRKTDEANLEFCKHIDQLEQLKESNQVLFRNWVTPSTESTVSIKDIYSFFNWSQNTIK